MSTYTDVFGNDTIPPSGLGYASFTLTTNTTFVWPYNTDGSQYPVAKVMDIACAAGNAITLPDARDVSTGEDFLIRNVGSNLLLVKDASGVQIASVAIGAASYFYLTDNTTAAGVYGVIGFGVGTSTADAASLVGYGIKAIGASLNQSHPVFPTNTGITVDADHRAKLVVFTGGTGTFSLTAAATLGDDYFTMFRNEGTGTATIDPAAGELIDGMSTMQVQPGESLMLICTGTQWYSVGYGRSVLYQFTQLTKDVSAGGTITLTAAEAANKLMTFIGNPTGAVNVVVPSIVAVYYTQSSISTAQTITLKTAAGSGVGISQGARIIALCDGTNVVSAQSAVANTSVSLTDGSAAVPALFFATQTNTGLYKSGTQDLGVTVNGSTVGVFGSTGLQTSTIGANSTQRHTLPAVASDTVALLAATQTFTNKTFTSPTITGAALTGGTVDNAVIGGVTPAAGTFTTLTTTGNIELGNASDTTLARSAAGVVTIEGVEVVTLSRSQTLTNKTISGANNTLTNIGNASLTNSSITINGNTVSLGGSTTVTATATNALTIGTGLTGTSYNGSTPVTIAIDSTVVTLTGSQTLTNKTLTSPSISSPTISDGTANGVLYLNGSKAVTSGSTLTFDGTNLGIAASGARINWSSVGVGGGLFMDYGTGAPDFTLTFSAAPYVQYDTTSGWPHVWAISSTEQMRLTSTGLGIGTSSPGANLQVGDTSQTTSNKIISVVGGSSNDYGAQLRFFSGSTLTTTLGQDKSIFGGSSSDFSVYATTGNGIRFYTNGANERLRIDSSGNLGLGVTPSAWNGAIKAYEVKSSGNALSSSGANNVYLMQNAMLGASGFTYGANYKASYYSQGNGIHTWYISTDATPTAGNPISFTQAMTLDASGYLAVGTTTARARITAEDNLGVQNGISVLNTGTTYGQGYQFARFLNSSAGYAGSISHTASTGIGLYSAGDLILGSNSTERARIDSSGNLGLGVTPSNWSGVKAFELGSGGNAVISAGSASIEVVSNGYYNGSSWIYASTPSTAAAHYYQTNGSHIWRTAPSGTAGNPISFTQAMTLDASGRLGVGVTSPNSFLHVKGGNNNVANIDNDGSQYTNLGFSNNGTEKSAIYWDNSNTAFVVGPNAANSQLLFRANNAERARIDSSGNLLVGTTDTIIWNTTNTGVAIGGSSSPAIQVSRSGDTALLLNRLATDGNIQVFARQGTVVGTVSVTTSTTSYNTSSDYRLKNITGPITTSGQYIDSLNPVEGTWKADGSTFVGLIAHEVQEVSRTKVATGEKDGEQMQGMDYSSAEIIANLIAEVQSLRKRLAALEAK